MTLEALLPWIALIGLGLVAVVTWVGTSQEIEHDPEDLKLGEWYDRYKEKEKQEIKASIRRSTERHLRRGEEDVPSNRNET